MNIQEFKAWFDGFSEGVNVVPTEKQWTKIKERISEIKDQISTPYPVFLDRYVSPYRHYWDQPTYQPFFYGTTGGIGIGSSSLNAVSSSYNSGDAFNALGKIEFESIKAA